MVLALVRALRAALVTTLVFWSVTGLTLLLLAGCGFKVEGGKARCPWMGGRFTIVVCDNLGPDDPSTGPRDRDSCGFGMVGDVVKW